jgi:3-oxoacyl-[acyl-carrier-protein] synthase III
VRCSPRHEGRPDNKLCQSIDWCRVGATGSILIGTLLDELERRDLKRGLVTMCAAGGMAPAVIMERM